MGRGRGQLGLTSDLDPPQQTSFRRSACNKAPWHAALSDLSYLYDLFEMNSPRNANPPPHGMRSAAAWRGGGFL
jgi:hypothetical protein